MWISLAIESIDTLDKLVSTLIWHTCICVCMYVCMYVCVCVPTLLSTPWVSLKVQYIQPYGLVINPTWLLNSPTGRIWLNQVIINRMETYHKKHAFSFTSKHCKGDIFLSMKRSSLAAAWLLPVTPVTQITSKWHIRFGAGLQVISQAISWRITNRQLTVQHILYYILSNSGFVKKTIKYFQSVPVVY